VATARNANEFTSMKEIHDRGYKRLFSNLEIFRQLITAFVRASWVKNLDFSKCELLKESFVSERYKNTFKDLIYKIPLRGRELHIVILLEFKATPYRFVALQMLGYLVDFYRQLVESGKGLKKLPPVFPIMLYRGKRRWTAPISFATLIEGHELLGKHALRFAYFPIIVNAFSKKALLKIGNIVSTLFLAEAHYDSVLLRREFMTLFDKTTDKQAIALLLNWFKQIWLHGRIDEADYKELEHIYHDRKEVAMMLDEAIKKEKKKFYNQGMEKVAKLMLARGEPLEKIRSYTGLSADAIKKLKVKIWQH